MPSPKQSYRQAIPNGCQREAEWLATNGNTEHASPFKANEYRRIFRAFVGAQKHHRVDGSLKSYREIAAEFGGARGYTTIRNWMREDFPIVFRAMGGHYEPFDLTQGGLSLAAVVLDALKDARAAMTAVTDTYERGELVQLLELMLNEAKRMPWEPSPF